MAMDVIKKTALDFNRRIPEFTRNLEMFDSELSSKLLYINKTSEKIRFLSYLRDFVESDYQEHAKVCHKPKSCANNESYEIAIYSIQQQYDDYFEDIGRVNISERPAMRFFSEGQYFDAFTSIKECVKKAVSSIVLIDGYVDENTLVFFPGKEPSISLTIITYKQSLNESFSRAIELYNKQYENLEVITSKKFHDRFLIIDEKTFYHIGASIKDAGNKTFMYSQIIDPEIMELIRKKIVTEKND